MTKTGYAFFSSIIILVAAATYVFMTRNTRFPLPVSPSATTTPPVIAKTLYTNQAYSFMFDPGTLAATTTFARSYFSLDHWSLLDSVDENTGENLIAFIVPNSNNITAAELRIGINKDIQQVKNCTAADKDTQTFGTTTINGTPFTIFGLGDAAMSHYLEGKIFRTVHNNTCFSLEEVITGTNPDVYEPKATVPFAKEDAYRLLDSVLNTFTFK